MDVRTFEALNEPFAAPAVVPLHDTFRHFAELWHVPAAQEAEPAGARQSVCGARFWTNHPHNRRP